MIASRRRAHRWLVLLLAPASLALLVAAVAARKAEPTLDALPGFLTGRQPVGSGELLWSREDVFASWPARVRAYRSGAIELKPLRPVTQPDVLLYWTPGVLSHEQALDKTLGQTLGQTGGQTAGSTPGLLPDDAHLIGRIGGTRLQRFQLPSHDRGPGGPSLGGGTLVLYSLGHQQIVASARLPVLEGAVAR